MLSSETVEGMESSCLILIPELVVKTNKMWNYSPANKSSKNLLNVIKPRNDSVHDPIWNASHRRKYAETVQMGFWDERETHFN